MGKMRASDKSIPSCTHAETLKFVVMIVLEMVCKYPMFCDIVNSSASKF